MSENEKRYWYAFEDPTRTALLLGSALRGIRDMLEAGKVEEAKATANAVIAEIDKYRMANEDQLTHMYFGKKK